jgi:AcrR family transcriptional regulator
MARIVKNSDERRGEIIKAARELFQIKDYKNATIQELIDKLNIAKGTFYHYFTSKQALLEAVVEDIVDEELRRKESLLQSSRVRNLNALEKIKILIIDDETASVNERILDNLHHPENTEMHTKQLGRYITKLAPLYAGIFKQGCDEGTFNSEHPLEGAEFIIAGVQFLTDEGFHPWGDAVLNRRMEAIPFLIEAQLGSLAGSFSFLNNRNKKTSKGENK